MGGHSKRFGWRRRSVERQHKHDACLQYCLDTSRYGIFKSRSGEYEPPIRIQDSLMMLLALLAQFEPSCFIRGATPSSCSSPSPGSLEPHLGRFKYLHIFRPVVERLGCMCTCQTWIRSSAQPTSTTCVEAANPSCCRAANITVFGKMHWHSGHDMF